MSLIKQERQVVVVVLAAGKGTRMRSDLPKVLHPVAGRPLLEHVLRSAEGLAPERRLVVIGHGAERVQQALPRTDLTWVLQPEQKGTGNAVLRTAAALPSKDQKAWLVILSGDVPLVRPETLVNLLGRAQEGWGAMAIAEVEEPGGLGRVFTGPNERLQSIVEAADATPEQLECAWINAGLYVLPAPEIYHYLEGIEPNNAKGEFYLTEALNQAAADGNAPALVKLEDSSEAWGVNTRRDLVRVHSEMIQRKLGELAEAGVTILDPQTCVVEPGVEIGQDTVLHPGVTLLGNCRIGESCVLHTGTWMEDAQLGAGVTILPYSVLQGVEVGDRCRIGPFARLRPGAVLEADVRIGNFVEIKNSHLEAGVKAGHLSYLGDASVGSRANIGAGTITCNYDGVEKHATQIGSEAFVGSDTMLVAPVRLGKRATTGAGSVISGDVPDGALAVERSRQRVVANWDRRRKDPADDPQKED